MVQALAGCIAKGPLGKDAEGRRSQVTYIQTDTRSRPVRGEIARFEIASLLAWLLQYE
jgi:hypothetical protein